MPLEDGTYFTGKKHKIKLSNASHWEKKLLVNKSY